MTEKPSSGRIKMSFGTAASRRGPPEFRHLKYVSVQFSMYFLAEMSLA